jgi:poly(A) polymerase
MENKLPLNNLTTISPVKYHNTYVSDEESDSNDDIESKQIENILRNDLNLYESREESRKREEVLGRLNDVIKFFIYKTAIKKGIPDEVAKETGGKIFTFGSYRLGVHGPGADIDVLCVAPDHVDRNDFFSDLVTILNLEKEVSDLFPVRDAYVPVIKMKFSGIQIDLLFARLSLKTIDDKLTSLQDDSILKNCDKESILSLNGCRVTDQILSLVPYSEHFRITLRVMKLWAKKRALYSNVFGYLGGVSWAILVAKVCQMFPRLKPNKLIRKFFEVFSQWDWINQPVQLNEIKKEVGFSCPVTVWPDDSSHTMVKPSICIITPAFPAMNSTYNVTETTKRILTKEFEFFRQFTNMIKPLETGNSNRNLLTWKDLFNEIDFFCYYSSYLQIDVLSTNEKDFKTWHGFVESKLRFLTKNLEEVIQIRVHPFPRDFHIVDTKFEFSATYFFGIEFVDPDLILAGVPSENARERKEYLLNINLRDQIKKFCSRINELNKRNPATMNVRITAKPNYQLPVEVLNREREKRHKNLHLHKGNKERNEYEDMETLFYTKKRKI